MTLDFDAHLRRELDLTLAALRSCDGDEQVPTCPEWKAADLAWHLGGDVAYFWSAIVRNGVMADAGVEALEKSKAPRPSDYFAVLDVLAHNGAGLADVLADGNDDDPTWTWSSDRTIGFVRRRMAQEFLVHRVDAEATAGTQSTIDADLATDGIAECLQWFVGGTPAWATFTPDGPVGRIRTTDTGGDWTFRVGSLSGTSPRGASFTDEPGVELVTGDKPSFTVEGRAADLDMWLWNRPRTTEPELAGPPDDIARMRAVIASGI